MQPRDLRMTLVHALAPHIAMAVGCSAEASSAWLPTSHEGHAERSEASQDTRGEEAAWKESATAAG